MLYDGTGKFRHQSIQHKELFVLVERTFKDFHKIVGANCLVASHGGGEMTLSHVNKPYA